ncbi:hypothetical protein [Raoultibacter phocaeensis]|uniref:hypothetical protein n=1 Tax=Raoultibacter phocaeensis TaxID=2479841 RepID=UPI00111B0695|nr:hypothetical protein [Raoultibacter phocaeensis]
MEMRAAEYAVAMPMEVVDGLGEVASSSGDLVQAIECAHMAVGSGLSDPDAYIEGMLGVLLLAAKYVHAESASLCDETERVLEDARGRRCRTLI